MTFRKCECLSKKYRCTEKGKKNLVYVNSVQGWMTVEQLNTGINRFLQNTFVRTENSYEISFKKYNF